MFRVSRNGYIMSFKSPTLDTKKTCLEFVFLLKICWHLAQMLFPSSVFLCYEVCVSETFVSTLVLVHLRIRVLVGCWEFVVAILCPVEKFTFLVI